jgi:hypothetical protein
MEAVQIMVFFAFGVWSIVRFVRNARKGDDLSLLPKIEEEFRTLVVDSEVPELRFDGRTADVVDDRQEGMMDEGTGAFTLHRVHRFARNSHGEYFFLISEGSGKPFFKHVTHVNARIALGKKYVAPGSANT